MSFPRYWILVLMAAAGCAQAGPGSSWDEAAEEVSEVGGAGGEGGVTSTSSSSTSSSSTSGAGGAGGDEGPPCTGDEKLCGGICKNVLTNPDHCGDCFQACAPGEICEAGECATDPNGGSNAWMCDPLSPEPKCGPNSRCQPRPDGNPVCFSPTGVGSQYDPCTHANQCDTIHECLQVGSNKVCLQWCMTQADCTHPGDTCFPFGQPMYVGAQAWGVCWNGAT